MAAVRSPSHGRLVAWADGSCLDDQVLADKVGGERGPATLQLLPSSQGALTPQLASMAAAGAGVSPGAVANALHTAADALLAGYSPSPANSWADEPTRRPQSLFHVPLGTHTAWIASRQSPEVPLALEQQGAHTGHCGVQFVALLQWAAKQHDHLPMSTV